MTLAKHGRNILANGAFAARSQLLGVKTNPEYDNIRSDPRFADLLRRMGLPQ